MTKLSSASFECENTPFRANKLAVTLKTSSVFSSMMVKVRKDLEKERENHILSYRKGEVSFLPLAGKKKR